MKKTFDISKCIPSAKADDYYLKIYADVPPKCMGGFVGCVENISNPDILIEIEIDNQFMFENRQLSCCFIFNQDNYEKSEIIMTAKYFDEFRNNDFMKFVVWHEIGHFHTKHYFNTVHDENGSAQRIRNEYLERGEIMPDEKVADLFALYYSSKEDAIDFFNYSIKRRRSMTWEPTEINAKAVRELCLRKRFIREFDDTDDNIRSSICKLCGIVDFELL